MIHFSSEYGDFLHLFVLASGARLDFNDPILQAEAANTCGPVHIWKDISQAGPECQRSKEK